MSESVIRSKLIKAYAKAGKILGREFDMFRPVALNDALSQENYLRKQKAAFSLTESFTSPQTEGFKAYITYTDYSDVRPGDIFSDSDETFVVVWNRGLEEVTSIRATKLLQIFRATWDTTNGLKPVSTRIAKNVPASVIGSTSTSDVTVTNVQNQSQSKRWEIRIWANQVDIKQTDNLKFDDGTTLHVDSIKVTEFGLILTCSEITV